MRFSVFCLFFEVFLTNSRIIDKNPKPASLALYAREIDTRTFGFKRAPNTELAATMKCDP
jgi:hypothetical protein